jgi:nucleotide-binding universal stress UspA family protein
MKTLQNILVPLDFSNDSVNSLIYAIDLAKIFNATITVLHSYHVNTPVSDAALMPVPAAGMYIQALDESIRGEAEEKFKALEKRHLFTSPKDLCFILRSGITKDNILEVSKEKKINLIVMSKEDHPAEFNLFGTHTTHLIDHTSVPILLIPDNVRLKQLSKILLCWDNKPLGHGTDLLVQLAAHFESTIEAFNVEKEEQKENDEKILQLYLDHLFKNIYHYQYKIQTKNTGEAILEEIEIEHIDLIVLSPRHHSLLQKIFKGSVTKKMILKSNVPVLVLPE